MRRRAGILLHPSSLPGPFGIGEIGPAARSWLAWLDAAGQRIWQILPLTVVDGDGCPYASPTTFAHEPLLLSLDDLVEDGWLLHGEKVYAPQRSGPVDWREVRDRKGPALRAAADRVRSGVDLEAWVASHPSGEELRTWAAFRAIAREHGPTWTRWPEPLRHRDPAALASVIDQQRAHHDRELALQWLFDLQWRRLREEAERRGIELWGDVPIFVNLESADVWRRPHLWRLDAQGEPIAISGVPPDAFSAEGQLWGHPLYAEEAHRSEGHAWWIARMRRELQGTHRVRIDHFRGFESVWEVPAHTRDARLGRWVPGAGAPLLEALLAACPPVEGAPPFVAEDLGVVTDEVRVLRDQFGLPGMVILQFAFGAGADHPYLPHHHRPNQVCYTGTHDNDTAVGYWRAADEGTRDHARRYLAVPDNEWPWAVVRAAWRSVCDTAIVPIQDVLGLGSEARMNVPGVARGNWTFRMAPEATTITLAHALAEQARLSGRL